MIPACDRRSDGQTVKQAMLTRCKHGTVSLRPSILTIGLAVYVDLTDTRMKMESD